MPELKRQQWLMVVGVVLAIAAAAWWLQQRQKKKKAASDGDGDAELPTKGAAPAPLPKVVKAGYSGAGRTVLEHIHDKIHENKYNVDFQLRRPHIKLQAHQGGAISSTDWPLAGACQPVDEPPFRGLNATEVIQGENSMRLYQTYSTCPGELNARYMSVQM